MWHVLRTPLASSLQILCAEPSWHRIKSRGAAHQFAEVPFVLAVSQQVWPSDSKVSNPTAETPRPRMLRLPEGPAALNVKLCCTQKKRKKKWGKRDPSRGEWVTDVEICVLRLAEGLSGWPIMGQHSSSNSSIIDPLMTQLWPNKIQFLPGCERAQI